MIKATLLYPATINTRGRKIANDAVFFCSDRSVPPDASILALTHFWSVLILLGQKLPPCHDWQQVLIYALCILAEREGLVRDDHPRVR